MALPAGNYNLDNQSSATSGAQGGTIKNGMIFNDSGGKIGIVKMLAIGAFGLIAYRLFFKKGGK